MIKRFVPHALGVVFLSLTLAACQVSGPAPAPTAAPLAGSLQTAVIPLPYDPPGFNAYLSDTGYEEVLGELVYEGLAEVGPDGSYYAKLALELPTKENGGISADGLTVTWHLRDHVVWSDGEPFTSDDVFFTYQALHHPNNQLAHVTGVELIDSVETPDDYTVVLHYQEPYADIWGQFGGRGTGIFPRHACGDLGWMPGWECNTDPVGTGPFILESWEEDEQVVMVRNPRYWQTDRPFLDQLLFPIIPDDMERTDYLTDGDAEIDLWLSPEQLEYLQEIEGLRLVTLPSRWMLRVVFNLGELAGLPAETDVLTANPALADPRVRQALEMGIDRQVLIDEAFEGHGEFASSEFYRGWANCSDIPETGYNPAAAQALLAQAGWFIPDGGRYLQSHGVPGVPDGTRFELGFLTSDTWESLPVAQRLIADMWGELGIYVQTDQVGLRDLHETWEEGGMEVHGQFQVDLWDAGYGGTDPTDYLIWRYASWNIPSQEDGGRGGNVMRFVNPDVDLLLQEALLQIDPRQRLPFFCRLGQILAEQRPMLYLVYFNETHGISPRVQNLVINPNDTITWDAFNWQVPPPAAPRLPLPELEE